MVSTHQNLTNVFSQFKVKKPIRRTHDAFGPIPTQDQKLEDGRENKKFNFSNVKEIDSIM